MSRRYLAFGLLASALPLACAGAEPAPTVDAGSSLTLVRVNIGERTRAEHSGGTLR